MHLGLYENVAHFAKTYLFKFNLLNQSQRLVCEHEEKFNRFVVNINKYNRYFYMFHFVWHT